jgi:hypothetical protein
MFSNFRFSALSRLTTLTSADGIGISARQGGGYTLSDAGLP